MKTATYKSLGLEWALSVPESLAELVQLAKGDEAKVVKIVNDHVTYHKTLGGIRSDFVEAVAQATGISRKTKVVKPEVKDAEGKVTQEEVTDWAESELEYFERVCAEKGVEPTAFADLQQGVIEKNPYDISERERAAPKPKTPTKSDFALADKILAAGSDKVEQVRAMLASQLGTEVASDRDGLARALMQHRKNQEAALEAQRASSLLG